MQALRACLLRQQPRALLSSATRCASDITNSKQKRHHIKGGFQNIWPEWSEGNRKELVKWLATRKTAKMPDEDTLNRELPVVKPDWDAIHNPPKDAVQVTWFGHSSVLVQMEGLNILTDPVWAKYCSPTQVIGVERYRPAPCAIGDLPRIDAVCVSHNHYDHLDYTSAVALGNRPTWFVPLGLKQWFAGVNISNVVELDWWEEHHLTPSVKFAATPAQHWSGRLPPLDRNKSLWCSWSVIGAGSRFFFTGDTGYCQAFREIGERYGPFTVAAIPIGAYEPRFIMRPQHIDPEEAVAIHHDLRAQHSLGIHWGTFVLTDENVLEPPTRMRAAMAARGADLERFFVLHHGQSRSVLPDPV